MANRLKQSQVEWVFDNLDVTGGSEAIEVLNKAKEAEELRLLSFGHFCRAYDLHHKDKDKVTGIMEILKEWEKL
jgi:hypothetical protein